MIGPGLACQGSRWLVSKYPDTSKSAKHTNATTAGPRVGGAAMMSLLLPSAERVKYAIMKVSGSRGVQVQGVCVTDVVLQRDVILAWMHTEVVRGSMDSIAF